MPESKQVCCCGADSWTKVVAWMQIVFSSLSGVILLLAFVYVKVSGTSEAKVENDIESPYNPEAKFWQVLGFGMLIALLVVIIISLVMGIVLLKGVNERNPKYVKSWLMYAIVGLVLNVILKFLTLQTSAIFGDVFILVLGIGWSGFLIWVVNTFKKELEQECDEEGGGAAYKSY